MFPQIGEDRSPGLGSRRPTLLAWAGGSAVGAAIVGVAGVVTLVLFYALEARHIRGRHAWGTDPNAVLGYANDVLGIVWFVLLIPFALALWAALRPIRRRRDTAASVTGLAAMAIGAASGLGLVTRLLDPTVEGAIAGLASVLVVGWIGVTAPRAAARGLLPPALARSARILAAVLVASLILAGLSLALPRSAAANVLTAVVAVPGLLAYLGVLLWLGMAGGVLLRSDPVPAS